MEWKKRGFTLIELLVVVLIIGILAAVAVPQYQLAVDKSKASECMAGLKTLRNAREAYYLANGTWYPTFSELDIDFPGKPASTDNGGDKKRLLARNIWYDISTSESLCGISSISAHLLAFRKKQTLDSVYKGTYFCRSYSSRGEKLCKSLGTYTGSRGDYKVYAIE